MQRGDATELFVLEKAGIARPPDIVLALTGDDEDNMIIGQIAREKYGVPKVIARVNDPRNQSHFDLLGISPTICATSSVMALVEHEVPEHDLIHLLELRGENLEIVEVHIDGELALGGPEHRGAVAARGLAAHLRHARRPGGDRRGVDRARGRRPGACDPRARKGGRATSRLCFVASPDPRRGRSSSPPAEAADRRVASAARRRRSRLRATTGHASAGTRAAATTTRTRPGSPPRTSARSFASRFICRARSTPPRSICTA